MLILSASVFLSAGIEDIQLTGTAYVLCLLLLLGLEFKRKQEKQDIIVLKGVVGMVVGFLNPLGALTSWTIQDILDKTSDKVLAKRRRKRERKPTTVKKSSTSLLARIGNMVPVAPSAVITDLLIDIPVFDMFSDVEVEFCSNSRMTIETAWQYGEITEAEIIGKVKEAMEDVCARDVMLWFAGIVIVATLVGLGDWRLILLLIPITIYSSKSVKTAPDMITESANFSGPKGLYRVYKNTLLTRKLLGVAYAENGVLYSKRHVCSGPIRYGQKVYDITLDSEKDDMVAWGGKPRIEAIENGENVWVEILHYPSQYSLCFMSTATQIGSYLAYKSIPTRPGVSGSPVFVLRDKGSGPEFVFCGCYGNSLDTDFTMPNGTQLQVEIAEQRTFKGTGSDFAIGRGGYYQLFMHPGAGKTRTAIPELIKQGSVLASKIVILTPTLVVANEFVSSTNMEVGTVFKGGTKPNKAAQVQVMAHATALSLMMAKKFPFRQDDIGFIIDESHVHNTKTLCLLELIRHHIEETRKGFAVEMSATGFDLITNQNRLEKGSNYHIQDRPYQGSTLERIIQVNRTNPGKKIVVFLPTVMGAGDTINHYAKTLKTRIPHVTIIRVHRSVFSTGYALAKEDYENGCIILTTSVSECGANYNADIVIDTMKQMTFRTEGNHNRKVFDYISEAQMIQRRGRVGRRKEGEYHYPVNGMELIKKGLGRERTAEAQDLEVFKRSIGQFGVGLTLTTGQVMAWLGNTSETDLEYHNPKAVKIVFARNGIRRTREARLSRIRTELLGGNIPIKVGSFTHNVQWWDDRDDRALKSMITEATGDSHMEEGEEVDDDELTEIEIGKFRLEYDKELGDVQVRGVPMKLVPEYAKVKTKSGLLGRKKLVAIEQSDEE